MSIKVSELTEYSFYEKDAEKNECTNAIINFLCSDEKTMSVENVEKDIRYQDKDIDILWGIYENNGDTRIISIEVKVDKYTSSTGNIAVETISNSEKGTIGCFLKTEAEKMFYIESDTKILYIIAMKDAQKWFAENRKNYRQKKTSTKTFSGKRLYRC